MLPRVESLDECRIIHASSELAPGLLSWRSPSRSITWKCHLNDDVLIFLLLRGHDVNTLISIEESNTILHPTSCSIVQLRRLFPIRSVSSLWCNATGGTPTTSLPLQPTLPRSLVSKGSARLGPYLLLYPTANLARVAQGFPILRRQ